MKKLIEQKLAIELLGTSPDGIIMFDPAGNILYLNQIAAKKYSQDEDELIGTNVWDLYPEAQVAHRKTVVNKVISTGGKRSSLLTVIKINGWTSGFSQ